MTASETAVLPPVLSERRGRVLLLTLNRPEKLNAWSSEMSHLLTDLIAEANDDDGIGCIIITGAGRGFSAGADLKRDRSINSVPEGRHREVEALPFFLQRSKPLIAAINGPAVGIGLTLSLCCDIRLASENARLSARFVRIGATPELASTFFLPQIAGLGNAAELMLTGRIIDAQDSLKFGLVQRVLPADELLPTAFALAEEIAFNPTQQVAWTKRLLYANATNDNLRSVINAEEEIFDKAIHSPAFAEAGRAFAERRDPRFHE